MGQKGIFFGINYITPVCMCDTHMYFIITRMYVYVYRVFSKKNALLPPMQHNTQTFNHISITNTQIKCPAKMPQMWFPKNS